MDERRATQQRDISGQSPTNDKTTTPTRPSPGKASKELVTLMKVLDDLHLWGVPASDIAQAKRNISRPATPSSSLSPPTELDLLLRHVQDALLPDPKNFRPPQPSPRAIYATATLPALLEEKLREELLTIGGGGKGAESDEEDEGDDDGEEDTAASSTHSMLHDKFAFVDGYGNAPMRRNPATGVITLLEWAKGYDESLLNPYSRFSLVPVTLRHSCYSHFGFGASQVSPASSSSYPSPPLFVPPPDVAAYVLGTGPEGFSFEVLVGREIVRQDMPCLNCGRAGTIAPAGGLGASFADFVCCACESHYELKVKNCEKIQSANLSQQSGQRATLPGGSFRQWLLQDAAFKSICSNNSKMPRRRHFLLALDRQSLQPVESGGGAMTFAVYASRITGVEPVLNKSSFTRHRAIGTNMLLEPLYEGADALSLWMQGELHESEWFVEAGSSSAGMKSRGVKGTVKVERFKVIAQQLLMEAFPLVGAAARKKSVLGIDGFECQNEIRTSADCLVDDEAYYQAYQRGKEEAIEEYSKFEGGYVL